MTEKSLSFFDTFGLIWPDGYRRELDGWFIGRGYNVFCVKLKNFNFGRNIKLFHLLYSRISVETAVYGNNSAVNEA